jgi:hypothetical protein
MQQEEMQLQDEVKKLGAERQTFITKARKERMSDEEFTPQIGTLYEESWERNIGLPPSNRRGMSLRSWIWKSR